MSRPAEWRSLRSDSAWELVQMLREGRQDGMPALTFYIWIAVTLGIAVMFSPWALLALPFPLLIVEVPRRPLEDITNLVTEPSPGPAFACRLRVRRGASTLGIDDGILTFVDGWLFYAGRRTDFAVRSGDVRGIRVLNGSIRFRTPSSLQIELDVFGQDVEDALRTWQGTPPEVGESVMPPAVAHPSGIALSWMGIARIASLGLVPIALVLTFAPWWTSLVLVALAFRNRSLQARIEELRALGRESRRGLTRSAKPLARS